MKIPAGSQPEALLIRDELGHFNPGAVNAEPLNMGFIQHRQSGSVGQVRDKWLWACRIVTKKTNPKHQIPNKSQIPMFNDQNLSRQVRLRRIGYSNFGHWDLFGIWSLTFGISIRH